MSRQRPSGRRTTSVPAEEMGRIRRWRRVRKVPATPWPGDSRSSVPRVSTAVSVIFSAGSACTRATAGSGCRRKSKKEENSRNQVERRLCCVARRVCTEKKAMDSMRRRTCGSSRSMGTVGYEPRKRCRKRSSASSSFR